MKATYVGSRITKTNEIYFDIFQTAEGFTSTDTLGNELKAGTTEDLAKLVDSKAWIDDLGNLRYTNQNCPSAQKWFQ